MDFNPTTLSCFLFFSKMGYGSSLCRILLLLIDVILTVEEKGDCYMFSFEKHGSRFSEVTINSGQLSFEVSSLKYLRGACFLEAGCSTLSENQASFRCLQINAPQLGHPKSLVMFDNFSCGYCLLGFFFLNLADSNLSSNGLFLKLKFAVLSIYLRCEVQRRQQTLCSQQIDIQWKQFTVGE